MTHWSLGDGFDLLEAVIGYGYGGLALLLFVYMIFTAIVLLNGLIGIFGHAFVTDDDDAPPPDPSEPKLGDLQKLLQDLSARLGRLEEALSVRK